MERKITKIFERYDPKEILSYLIFTFYSENDQISYDRISPPMMLIAYEILSDIPEYSEYELNVKEIEWCINGLKKIEIKKQVEIDDFHEKIKSENYFINGDTYTEFSKEENIAIFSDYNSWFKNKFNFTIEEIYEFIEEIKQKITLTYKKEYFDRYSDLVILNKREILLDLKNKSGFESFIELLKLDFYETKSNRKYKSFFFNPFIFFDDENFLPIYTSILDNLRYILENIIEKYGNKDKYNKKKGSFLEDQLYIKVSEKFKSSKVFKNPKCRFISEELEEFCDILLVYDNNLVLFEAKAKQFNLKVKEIGRNKIIDNIKDILVESYKQLEKSKEFKENNERLILYDQTGKNEVLNISSKAYPNVFLVSVTLDNLGSIGTNVKRLEKINYKIKKNIFSLNLADLKIIFEHTEFPSQFIHYLIKLNEIFENVNTQYTSEDEIDYFCHYQKTNYDNDPKECVLKLPNYRNYYFNQYYLDKESKRNPDKIYQELPLKFKEIIYDLEYKILDIGKSNIIFELLNLPFAQRNKIGELISFIINARKHGSNDIKDI